MPPTTLDENYEPRSWACDECKRILGVVMRDTSRVRRLYVFQQARSTETMPTYAMMLRTPRGMFSILGIDWTTGGVECPQCGARREWSLSTELKAVVNESV